MTTHDAYEQAYLNGYAKGYEAGLRDSVRHGHWISSEGHTDQQNVEFHHAAPTVHYKCSECGTEEVERFAYCHCGAKMDIAEGGGSDGESRLL